LGVSNTPKPSEYRQPSSTGIVAVAACAAGVVLLCANAGPAARAAVKAAKRPALAGRFKKCMEFS
jgi:hypothetical protein